MAILSKTLDRDDMNQNQLTITETFNTEPFPSAENDRVLKVKDEQGSFWKFNYKVKSRNRRVLYGHDWVQFVRYNGVQVGNKVAIDRNDAWCSEAAYKIEVIST